MGFDLGAELAAVRGQGYDLHSKYLNPQLPRTLRTIGFDKDYVRGEGAYLYDAEGNAYAAARAPTSTTPRGTRTRTSWPGSGCSPPVGPTR